MHFCSKKAEEKLKTFKMSYFGGALYIDHDGQIVSFCSSPVKDDELVLLTDVIKAFLLSNPEGFHRIISAMLAEHNRFCGLKDLLTHIEVVSNRLCGDITAKAFLDPYFSDFKTLRRYPTPIELGTFTRNIPEYISSYDIRTPYYWKISIGDSTHGLIEVLRTPRNEFAEDHVLFSSWADCTSMFMTPIIFKEAMKTVLALDHDAFFDAYNIVKEHFEKSEHSWNSWYFQMCLMIDVFKNYERKLNQASRFCPWIDYD